MDKLRHTFTQLRSDADLFMAWYIAIGVTALYTLMNLAYWKQMDSSLLWRGSPETVLALLAAGGRGWARVMLGAWLVLSAMGAGLSLAIVESDVVHRLFGFMYAAGMTLAAVKAFRLI